MLFDHRSTLLKPFTIPQHFSIDEFNQVAIPESIRTLFLTFHDLISLILVIFLEQFQQ